ncbi:MAG TPA: phage holin family protein [Moorella mulderi]|nr:phage holin family protein [Moorella mulderi]
MGNWIGALVRLIVSAIVLMLVAFLLPGIGVAGFKGAFLAALVIAILGWLVEALFGERISPKARGVVGFVVSALVIYLAQFVVPGYLRVTLIGALLAALVIGVIDAFVPTELLGKGIEVFNSGPLRGARFLL